STGGSGWRWGRGRGSDGYHPGQFGCGEFFILRVALARQSGRHALELGTLSMDALFQQRRAVPGPDGGTPAGLGVVGTRGPRLPARFRRDHDLALYRPGTLIG